ncbi:hypothetical protein F5Y14DRAFT_110550 [Nemania sp. NC0429]|nr:hypothetical protein F5Y14DRAFT_110550 [Nemania sp. NC0429]
MDPTTTNIDPTTTDIDPATTNMDPTTTYIDPTTINIDPTTTNINPTTIDIDLTTINMDLDSLGLRRDWDHADLRFLYSDNATFSHRLSAAYIDFTQVWQLSFRTEASLLALSDVTNVLRRLLSYEMTLIPPLGDGYKQPPFLYLALQEPNLIGFDNFHLLVAMNSLERDYDLIHRGLSFTQIIHHRSMRDFWNLPRMRLFQKKRLLSHKANDEIKSIVAVDDWDNRWRNDMLMYRGNKNIQQLIDETFLIPTSAPVIGYQIPCCNFPRFIRIRYDAACNSLGFHQVRQFTVKAFRIRDQYFNDRHTSPQNLERGRARYTLIACVFLRDDDQHAPAVRLYDLSGKALQPENKSWGFKQRIGMGGTTCFLFYGQCSRFEGEETFPEVPEEQDMPFD